MVRHFRVAEVFGPTIQGEGRQAGLPSYFIRFGGCDLRCSWCDTPHAVLPEQVAMLPKQNVETIMERIMILDRGPRWVVITGGNPALLHLEDLVDELHGEGLNVMVETQGTHHNTWLWKADEVCVSPKPPSSGNLVAHSTLKRFMSHFSEMQKKQMYFKVVVFDDFDYGYAQAVHEAWPEFDFFISAGNEDPSLPTVGNPYPELKPAVAMGAVPLTQDVVLDKMRWLMDTVKSDPRMADVRVLPQLHVLAWGNERGR